MDLPRLQDLDVAGKKVLLRMDLDCDPNPDEKRIKCAEETLNYLKEKGAEIIILGHRGRPDGKVDESLSLTPFQPIFDRWGARIEENLRFNSGEEANDPEFAKQLASLGDIFVNEAFASSHRSHASIVGLPEQIKYKSKFKNCIAAGFRFQAEVTNLSKVLVNPKRPLVFLISGLKEDKLNYVKSFENLADRVLVGGRLPELVGDESLKSIKLRTDNEKVWIGNLNQDKEDITLNTIDIFGKEIAKAGTIVVSGPLGKFEDEGHRQGTAKVFEAVVANKNAFKIAGGGDTEKAIQSLSPSISLSGFDWVSVGGGAMLDFLAKGTLPGIEALKR
jgi:phosphoglycerate kinase